MTRAKLASLKLSASGKTLLAVDQDGSVRAWDIAELPDDLDRMATWVEVVTGSTTDSEGSIKPLDHDAWEQRRALLTRLGGPPEPSGRPAHFRPESISMPHGWFANGPHTSPKRQRVGRWSPQEFTRRRFGLVSSSCGFSLPG